MPVESRRRLSKRPDEARIGQISVRDEELEPRESRSDPAELLPRNGNLEIFVLSSLLTEEELDRPAGSHIPRCPNSLEQSSHLLRTPGVPKREVGFERPGRQCIFELHSPTLPHLRGKGDSKLKLWIRHG